MNENESGADAPVKGQIVEGKTKLFAALVEAQKKAKAVEKTSANKHHGYKYASTEAVIEEARGALAEAGLALIAMSHEIIYGGDKADDALLVRYLLVHTSGESLEIVSMTPIIEGNGRPADKALATARTYDLGYTLRALLLLPRVEEGADVETRDDSGYAPKKQAPQRIAPKRATGRSDPPPIQAVPQGAQATQGESRQAQPQVKPSEAPSGDRREAQPKASGQVSTFASISDFWSAVRALGLQPPDVQRDVSEIYGVAGAGNLTPEQRAEYVAMVRDREGVA